MLAVSGFVAVGLKCRTGIGTTELWIPVCGLGVGVGLVLTAAWLVRRTPGHGRLAALVTAGAFVAGLLTGALRQWQVQATMARLPTLHDRLVHAADPSGRLPEDLGAWPEAHTALGWGDERFGYMRTDAGYCVSFRRDPGTMCLSCGDAQAPAPWACASDTL